MKFDFNERELIVVYNITAKKYIYYVYIVQHKIIIDKVR